MSNLWLREFDIYRHGSLVYLRTLKCASSYYSRLFANNGWTQQTADTIDWDRDHVFSFIMDPHERRLKGLTEFVVANHQLDLLRFEQIFWGGVLYMDMHAIPYSVCYGQHVEKIDWIPLDCQNFESDCAERMVKHLLKDYGLVYDFPDQRLHESDQQKLQVYETIKQKTGNANFAMHIGLEADINLYHRVCCGVSPWLMNQHNWKGVSWLK